jgi:hypothetical protein
MKHYFLKIIKHDCERQESKQMVWAFQTMMSTADYATDWFNCQHMKMLAICTMQMTENIALFLSNTL